MKTLAAAVLTLGMIAVSAIAAPMADAQTAHEPTVRIDSRCSLDAAISAKYPLCVDLVG